MRICIINARGRLGNLIQCAQKGEDVVFTRRGLSVACLVSIYVPPTDS
jgi:antitoxin (DNA-binding transcriptional repressor) of toxin-antitoxin stability system